MTGYYDLDQNFDEGQLPPGQKPIETRSLKRFKMFVEMISRSKQKTGYTSMGAVTGISGIGKTIALLDLLQRQELRAHIGLPDCIVIKVQPRPNPRTLLEQLLRAFGERPRGVSSNRHKIADDAVEVIFSNDPKTIFWDDADHLNVDCFDFLAYIFDQTHCPMAIVGLPQIWRVINHYEKFSNRVGLRCDFLPPDEQEILETILPQIILPSWRFDPTDTKDFLLGQELWGWVKPSFRNLRTVLQYASQFAELQGKERITRAILLQSYKATPIPKRREVLAKAEIDEELDEEETQTKYENTSVLRKQAKEAKNPEESAEA
jgi:hypothetical protein